MWGVSKGEPLKTVLILGQHTIGVVQGLTSCYTILAHIWLFLGAQIAEMSPFDDPIQLDRPQNYVVDFKRKASEYCPHTEATCHRFCVRTHQLLHQFGSYLALFAFWE